jgi:hypothetical protein
MQYHFCISAHLLPAFLFAMPALHSRLSLTLVALKLSCGHHGKQDTHYSVSQVTFVCCIVLFLSVATVQAARFTFILKKPTVVSLFPHRVHLAVIH